MTLPPPPPEELVRSGESGRADAAAPCGIVIAIGDVSSGRLVYEALRTASPTVSLVTSATEALRQVEALHPVLLVVDDELPLVRGLDVAGRVRGERSDADVILLTADAELISLVGRLRVERLRCIEKPFAIERLRQAVGVSLRALAQRREHPTYDDLMAELEEQRARFEQRIRNLERRAASEPAPPPGAVATEPAAAERPMLPDDLRVLVVDDDPLVRRAMARALSKQQVILAENGLAATRELEKARPDVIVSDLRMPEMDGLALADEVRRRWPELADRIVFVSGTGSQIQRAEAEAPTRPVLRKPVEGSQLEDRIAEVLERAMRARNP